MQAIEPTVDLAALESEDKAYLLSRFRQRQGGAPPCVKHSWGQDGTASPRRGGLGVVVKDDAVWNSASAAAT